MFYSFGIKVKVSLAYVRTFGGEEKPKWDLAGNLLRGIAGEGRGLRT